MKIEIHLSDTAREDLDQLPEGSPQRGRVETLLEQIAAGEEGDDRRLSAPESAFSLRYVSLETTYVFFRRDAEKQEATVFYFCEMGVQTAAAPSSSPPYRVIDLESRDIPHGMEVNVAVEFTQPDGSRRLVRNFVRKIDMGDSYIVFQHTAKDTDPATTMILSGKKGRVEGDFRHDELELTTLKADGTVQRFPPNIAPVWIKNPFEGATTEEMMARMPEWMKGPEAQARLDAARKWRELG